ncbi:MAG TPA: DUF115 domain-containing protein [Spirochaetia bacterium]|nr:DUF115 domain-containing protein [Spirochaetia bacterium]
MKSREDTRRAANLEALGRRLPGLAELLRAEAASEAAVPGTEAAPFLLAETPSGWPSARLPGGAWLHSSRDPRLEASRLAASAEGSADAILVLGFGLGYLPEALLAAGAERVIVCEAEPRALLAALGARDLGPILGDERLGFVLGGEPDAAVTALELSGASRAALLGLPAAEAASPAWYRAVRAAASRWNAKGAVNEATLRRFGRLWVRNLSANVGRVASCPGVERLAGLAAGLPAIVLAAGPSLDEVLPSIREIAQRAIVVCVDTALRGLLRSGLEPDFLVVVDPQFWNWRHLAGLAAPSSILVSESAAWPAVFRFPCRRTFLGGSLFPLGRRLEAASGRKGLLGAGGSVATSAWDLARLMGAEPIWMAGLDLGYPGGKTHARASLFEQRSLAAGTRLAPASSAQAGALFGARSFSAPAAGGGSVLTDERMSLYAWWFESRLARPGSPKTLSLCPAGLAIPGMAAGSLEELLALPPRRREIEARLGALAGIEAPASAREGARAGLAALKAELGQIAREAREAARTAARGRAELAAGGSCRVELAALAAADERILGNAARDLVGFLLPPAAELVGRAARDLGESLERSERLYRQTAESAEYQLERLAAADLG